jgi:hypothetical protein
VRALLTTGRGFLDLAAELGLPVDVDTGLELRNVAGSYGIEVTQVRDAVQRYQDSH